MSIRVGDVDGDAYDSLWIEGYRVSREPIGRVRGGEWNPDQDPEDRDDRNALAAGAVGGVERAHGRLGGDGDPAVEGIRIDAGDVAGMQMAYDLWQARGRAGEIAVERFVAA